MSRIIDRQVPIHSTAMGNQSSIFRRLRTVDIRASSGTSSRLARREEVASAASVGSAVKITPRVVLVLEVVEIWSLPVSFYISYFTIDSVGSPGPTT